MPPALPSRAVVPTLGVVIVTFNAEDVILDCLESLLAATGVRLQIVVVDNASTDHTITALRDWAAGRKAWMPPAALPFALTPAMKPLTLHPAAPDTGAGHAVTLLETGVNTGFAGGVNAGLAHLAALPGLDRFWVLNPDSVVPAATPRAFAVEPEPAGGFALMGGRVLYLDRPDTIQIDGGTLNRRTGVTSNLNLFAMHGTTPPPDPAQMDFITGASLVVSRRFYEQAGPMPEDYFLYYEEVDWAQRRGPLPLIYCRDSLVYHHGGTAIGSPIIGRPASPFSLYFKYRARARFMRRHFATSLPVVQVYALAKAGQILLRRYPREAWAILAGAFDLPPPAAVRAVLSPEAAKRAFAPRR